ncbi:MAG TPA: aspartate aminotransferase family protein [Candidatus Dormibacteraeota bacterium]
MLDTELSRLQELDSTYWLHPQGDLGGAPGTVARLVFDSGEGARVHDVSGRTYVDALSGLWNVNVGWGRTELAHAAAEQMTKLSFESAYGGFAHRPGIELAERLAQLVPKPLEFTFFAGGGAEANDTAYKLVRLYWTLRGEPQRVKIVSRLRDYHGLTYGATSATGLQSFWQGVQPLAPGFVHAPAPDPYRFTGTGDAGQHYADELERVMDEAGADTIAAVIVEPVQGAGGLIVPPPGYLGRVRELCDRRGVLLIADEVITGFGRTGSWFASQTFDFTPDLLLFAKGVTSGYLPLSGVVMTRAVRDVLRSLGGPLPHAFTYSGHPVSCAVALRNLRIIEDEGLVERARRQGAKLLEALRTVEKHGIVGDVRGCGLMSGVELVQDRARKTSFEPAAGAARKVVLAMLEHGVITRPLAGDVIGFAPPFVVTDDEIAQIVDALDRSLAEVAAQL